MIAVLLITAWFAGFVGAAFLAVSSRSQQIAATGRPSRDSTQRRKRGMGWALLTLALLLAVLNSGWGIGLLLGPLLIVTDIAAVIAILSVRPRALSIFAG